VDVVDWSQISDEVEILSKLLAYIGVEVMVLWRDLRGSPAGAIHEREIGSGGLGRVGRH
jgi:hypothetical protein